MAKQPARTDADDVRADHEQTRTKRDAVLADLTPLIAEITTLRKKAQPLITEAETLGIQLVALEHELHALTDGNEGSAPPEFASLAPPTWAEQQADDHRARIDIDT